MVTRTGTIFAVLAAAFLAGTPAYAEYSDECRALAVKLAGDPGAVTMGELDILKNCVSSLQRGIVLKEPPPAKGELPACAPVPAAPVTPVPACPVCPTAEKLCPKREAPAAASVPASREKAREPADDRRLKPYLPKF